MTPINLFTSRRNKRIQKIVGLYPKTLAPGNLDPRPTLIFFAKLVTKFSSATWSERNHLVREMRVTISRFVMAESPQSFNHRVLRFRLPRIDDVVYLRHIAEVRMIPFALGGRDPAIVGVGIA